MANVSTSDHLVRPEKDSLVNGYDNDGFHSHSRGEDGEESASDDERLRVVVTENGRDADPLPNGHESNGHAVNGGTAVVFVDEDNMDHPNQQQKPLDTRLHHYVTAEDMDRKILNGSEHASTHVSIPEDAVISFSSGRVRVKKGAPSSSPQSQRDRESIPLETMPPSYEGNSGLSGEKAELEAELSNHKNGVWSEGHTYSSAESQFISEKLNGTSKSSDEVSLPVNNHRKCLRGEKLYFTEESRKLCPGWRRLLICGLILIMVAIALLLGVLAATGILLSKSDSKNTRYESGYSLPNMDSVSHAGHSFRPKPSSKVPQKFQPPVTVGAEHLPNATLDVRDTVSQALPTVTSKVPPLLNDSSHSQTIVPNALVGEFKIIDENFTDDLNDHSSRGYLNLARNLETELHRIFRDNGGKFDELKILNFRPGSIRVKFVVIWSSDEGIISPERATEILSEDLKKKNDSFYNFFYVDISSIHFINVFDECRIQKGGCMFDCVWNYDTLLKTCICPKDMYLLPDGKSCSPKPETSSTVLFETSTTSPEKKLPLHTLPIFAVTEPIGTSRPSQETQPTHFPLPDVVMTTTPKSTEFYPTDENPTTEIKLKGNLDTTSEPTTTEAPTTYPQTFPVEVVDDMTTPQQPKESSYNTGEKIDTFTPETTTVPETTLLSEDVKTERPQTAFNTETVAVVEEITTQAIPSSFRGYSESPETFTTEAKETIYPHYDTTMKYSPTTYPPNVRTDTSSDETDNPPTTKISTLKYHIPEPTTEVYTWSPHYDYPTESFKQTSETDTPTEYTAFTNPEETTFPVTYEEGIVGESETTTELINGTATPVPSIKREGTWQENQTLPTSFDGNVSNGQSTYTTVKDETNYETTYFPQNDSMADNQTTPEFTKKDDFVTPTNPYEYTTFPFFVPSFNRTPGLRSYDNFTDYYDNTTFVDHDDSTDTTLDETQTETDSTMSYFSSSWNESTSHWPATETAYSGDISNATMLDLRPNVSDESATTTSNVGWNPELTTQYGLFNVSDKTEHEVTDETLNPTFPTESNTNFSFKAVTNSYLTETPTVYNKDGMNLTNSGDFYPHVDTETTPGNYTTFAATGIDETETTAETFNPTFPSESTAQFPSKVSTEAHPRETTWWNYGSWNWTTTESFYSPSAYNTETTQANATTYPIGGDETETTLQPIMNATSEETTAEPTTHFDTSPGHTESFPYINSNATYETETTAMTDSETTFDMQGNDTTNGETTFVMDDVMTHTPLETELPTSPDYPQKSAKSETESSFYGWQNFTTAETTTVYPDHIPQVNTSTASYPTLNLETETVMEATTIAADAESDTTTPFPFPDLNIQETHTNQTSTATAGLPLVSNNTESDLTKVAPFDTTLSTVHETYTTNPYEETITTGGSAYVETEVTTFAPETEETIPAYQNASLFNDMQPMIVTSKTSLTTDTTFSGETDTTTPAYTELESFSNGTDVGNTTLMLSETSDNSTVSYNETAGTKVFRNESEQEDSTLMYPTTLSDDNSNTTDITGFPYDIDEATTFAPYAYEDTTVIDEAESNLNLTSDANGYRNFTYEIGAFDNFNSTDNNYTAIDESANMTTTTGYEMLNETTTNASIGIICREDQFICEPLNTCLNYTFMCDGIQDCPDGIDESDCQGTCHTNFKCSNSSSMCIMSELQCDGIWDCENGTDEEFCTPSECAKHEVICSDKSKCIRPSDICDLKYDCKDRSDEVGCVERTTCESGGKFFCNDGLCIPWSLKCDGEYDCKDKEDEGNCTCFSDEFQCNDGKCLKSSSRCDGHRDCYDGDDEMGCVNVDAQHLVMTYEPYSGTWAMLCAEDWSLDDGHYLCQELGFGHALKTEKLHVSFNGTWMAMRRENLTDASLWTERVSFVESCTSSLAASVECQKFACGEYPGLLHRRKREVGSSSSSSSQWPFVGYTSTFYSSKGCLSEILTPIWLITSADCLLSISKEPFNGSDWYVRTNIGRSVEAGSAQNHEVLRMISHPHSSKFRSLTLRDYDVALIRLKHALVFVSDKIGAICPPEEQVPSGITCFSGVLSLQTPRAPPPTTLTINSLALQIIDRKNCNSVDHYNNLINQRMLCTQSSEGHTICDKDEGTPLMCLTGINKWFLAGMLSYQRHCEVYNKHPAVFSNLYSMRKFIDQVTGQKQYEIPHNSNVYMIIPPTTPSPTIPETTTVMYTTTESLTTTETTVSDFTTPVAVLNYAMTVNGTTYESVDNTTLMANFTESSTTPLESMYEDATLPSDEFIEEMRSTDNYTTLAADGFIDENVTETTVGNIETTFAPKEVSTIDYGLYGETSVFNLTSDNTTGDQDFTTIPPFTDPTTEAVTLNSETTFDLDNSTEFEPKMFETAFNNSDIASNKTHDSMIAPPNETYSGNDFAHFWSENKTELYGPNTTYPPDETTATETEEIGMFPTTTDYDVFNSSMISLTRMPVMSMANETLDSVIEPERLTLTTVPEQVVGAFPTGRYAEERNATPTTATDTFTTVSGIEVGTWDLTTTENPDWMNETSATNYTDAITEIDSRKIGFTEKPLLYKEASTVSDDLKETETDGFTENPLMEEITTTEANERETTTESVLKMEGRAETFLEKETTPADFSLKESPSADSSLKDTTPTDFSLKETTPADFNLTETATDYFNLNDTTPEELTLKDTAPEDFALKETTPAYSSLTETATDSTTSELKKSYLTKETTTTDLGLTETETPYEVEETTTPVSGWTEATTESAMKVDGITENLDFNDDGTTPAPESTTPSLETRTLLFETEVGTDGDIALIAFNDSDGIVLQPAESPDALSIVESNGNATQHNASMGRKLDEPAHSSDILYDTMQPETDATTPDATFSVTTEWEDYYTTLTTPGGVDGTQDSTTETALNDSTTPSHQLLKESTETTPNPEIGQNVTETTPPVEYNATTTPEPSLMKLMGFRSIDNTPKENFLMELSSQCGTWDRPSNQTNDTQFYKEWPVLGYLQLISDKRMCAATLISNTFAVTSLNCLAVRDYQLDPEKWAYVGGVHDPIEGQQTHLVAEIIPFTNSSTSVLFHESNLALVRMKYGVKMTNFSTSACLPKDIQPDQQCYTAGWSKVPTGKEEGKRFYSVPVAIIPHDECNSTSNYNGLLLDSLICASYSSESFPTCQMDLGSPLFCLNNEKWELQGVLNFPNPCDMVQPAVYNSIFEVKEWIQDTLFGYTS